MNRTRAATARLGRLRRRLGFDRNGLRRKIDRRQQAVGLAAFLLFAGLGPVAFAGVASRVYDAGLQAEAQQSATHRQITARIVRTETTEAEAMSQEPTRHAFLDWTTPDGRPHSATISVGRWAQPGDQRQIWVAPNGELTRRPQNRADTVTSAAFAGGAAAAAAGFPLLAVYLLVRRSCDRCRERSWDAEWARLFRRQIS